ncbi:hypothetical protein D3OALGA1CA_5072 [Olavius algarvensis associated proteobacterium Delta 3]|nr:hypothetical protein D3OALGA1CA_5072 [Olavius algarvensis associated proteobacterium Delta 3]
MTVYFHGSFGLNRKRMAGIIGSALKNSKLRDQELAEPFGYNAPFTARYRSWLHKTGMIELRYPIRLTELGKVVYENDPKMDSLTTQWFLHHELTTDPDRAEAWHYFVREFLPQNKNFTKEDLLAGLTEKLRAHSEQHFGPGSQLNKVILRKILECYTKNEALGELKIITEQKGVFVFNNKVKKKGPWRSTNQLSNAY